MWEKMWGQDETFSESLKLQHEGMFPFNLLLSTKQRTQRKTDGFPKIGFTNFDVEKLLQTAGLSEKKRNIKSMV